MTQDEIIEMVQEAGFSGSVAKMWSVYFEALIKLAAAKEREACALICERVYKRMCPEAQENEVGIEAEIIRARGEA